MGKVFVIIKNILFGLILFFTIVLSIEWIASRIVVNKQQVGGTIPVYLLSNGVHTDIVMPVKSKQMDWSTIFKREHTKGQDSSLNYIGIGWGDKGFYLETPTWADLKFSTAIKAVTGLSSSALHCTFMNEPQLNDRCVKMFITEEQYLNIIQSIQTTLKLDHYKQPMWIKTEAVYGNNDAFYEAKGSYYLFKTCNTWTNSILKGAGLKAACWLAFSKPLINIYK